MTSIRDWLAAELGLRFRRGPTGLLVVEDNRLPRPRKEPRVRRSPITSAQRSRILTRDGFRCRRCGNGPDEGARLVVDHVVPVALGGSSQDKNLQTLCSDCNAGKSDSPPHPHDLRGLTS